MNNHDDLVRERAYLLWEQAGYPDDRSLEFWFAAASELEAEQAPAGSSQPARRRAGRSGKCASETRRCKPPPSPRRGDPTRRRGTRRFKPLRPAPARICPSPISIWIVAWRMRKRRLSSAQISCRNGSPGWPSGVTRWQVSAMSDVLIGQMCRSCSELTPRRARRDRRAPAPDRPRPARPPSTCRAIRARAATSRRR